MTTQIRNIIRIDSELCTGCGQCVLDCAEGAIAIVDGKARVVSESYCDGLGACLQGCPAGALAIERREAPPFDEEAAMAHVAGLRGARSDGHEGCPGAAVREFAAAGAPGAAARPFPMAFGAAGAPAGGCPSSQARTFGPAAAPAAAEPAGERSGAPCRSLTWPVKLRLVPAGTPFLAGADVVLAADCAPAASGRFHELADGRVVLIACPKFEDNADIAARLQRLFAGARPASVTVVRMEVPCCRGLAAICLQAARAAGVPARETVMGCDGRPKAQEPAPVR